MKIRLNILFLIAFFAVCNTIVAQEKKQTTNAAKEYIIPFVLTEYNNISVEAILNKNDTVHLMFHTAANAVTLTEEATARLKSVHFDEVTDSVKSWGGQANASRLSKSNILQIGGLQFEAVSIWENKNSGQHTDGKFGTDLFANKVIEIDFDKKQIVVTAALPRKIKKYEKLKLLFEDDEIFLEADCAAGDSSFKNKFLIHSGYSGAVLLDDKFVADHDLGNKLKIAGEKSLKDSFGNTVKTKKAVLPSFTIGNEKLYNVPAGFFEGAIGRQKMSIIGGDILKRFNIIIDAERKFIYLKASHFKDGAYTSI